MFPGPALGRTMRVIEILGAAHRIAEVAGGVVIPLEENTLVAQKPRDDVEALPREGALGADELMTRQRQGFEPRERLGGQRPVHGLSQPRSW